MLCDPGNFSRPDKRELWTHNATSTGFIRISSSGTGSLCLRRLSI
jgi:hypothetical protein